MSSMTERSKKPIRLLCIVLLITVRGFAQDSVSPTPPKLPRYVYVINPDSQSEFYSVDPLTGGLRFAGTIENGIGGYGVAMHPNGNFVYFAAGGAVQAYVIGLDGTLASVPGSPFLTPGASYLSAIAVSKSGRFLIAADYVSGVWAFTVNETTGALTIAPGSPYATGNTPYNLTIDPTSMFVYVSCEKTGVSGYVIDQMSGGLTQMPGSPFALSKGNSLANGITVDSSANYVYVEGESGIDGYKIDRNNGSLDLLPGSPFSNGGSGQAIATDPLGKFIYGASWSGLYTYTIASGTGTLTVVSQSGPLGISTVVPDPTGNLLYTTGLLGGNAAFQVNRKTGGLVLLTQNGNDGSAHGFYNLAVNTGFTRVDYVPRFAYVANSGDNTVSAYKINPTN